MAADTFASIPLMRSEKYCLDRTLSSTLISLVGTPCAAHLRFHAVSNSALLLGILYRNFRCLDCDFASIHQCRFHKFVDEPRTERMLLVLLPYLLLKHFNVLLDPGGCRLVSRHVHKYCRWESPVSAVYAWLLLELRGRNAHDLRAYPLQHSVRSITSCMV